jgi:hypothetical protein
MPSWPYRHIIGKGLPGRSGRGEAARPCGLGKLANAIEVGIESRGAEGGAGQGWLFPLLQAWTSNDVQQDAVAYDPVKTVRARLCEVLPNFPAPTSVV